MIQRTGINDPNATGVAAPEQVQSRDTFGVAKVGRNFNAEAMQSIAKFGEKVGVRELEKEAKSNYVAGQALRASQSALTGKEPAPTRRGYKALDAKLKGQAWMMQQKELIDNELNDLSPEEYASILSDNVSEMFTGDDEIDNVLTASMAQYSGELGRYHSEANYKKRTADGISQATADVRNHIIAIETAKKSGDVEGESNARAALVSALKLPTVQNPVIRKQLAGDLAVMSLELGDPSVLNHIRVQGIELDVDQERKIAAAEAQYNQKQKRKLDVKYQQDTADFETSVLASKSLDEMREHALAYQEKYPDRTTNEYIINQENIFRRALATSAKNKLFKGEMLAGNIAKINADPKQVQETFESIKVDYLNDPALSPDEANKAIRNVWKSNGIVIGSIKTELTAGLSVPLKDGKLHPNFESAFNKASEYYADAPDLMAKHLSDKEYKMFLDTKAATTYGGMDLGSAVSMLEEHRVTRAEMSREEREDFTSEINDSVDTVLGRGFFNFNQGITTSLENDAEIKTRLTTLANIALNQGMKDPEAAVEWARTEILKTHEQLGNSLVYNGGTEFYKRLSVPKERVNDAMDYMYEKLTEADPTINRDDTVLLGNPKDSTLLLGIKNEYGVINRVISADLAGTGTNFRLDVLDEERRLAENAESTAALQSEQERDLIRTATETGIYTEDTAIQAIGNMVGRQVLESRVADWQASKADAKLAEEYGTESKEELEDLKFMKSAFSPGKTLTPKQIKLLQDGDIEGYKATIGAIVPETTKTVTEVDITSPTKFVETTLPTIKSKVAGTGIHPEVVTAMAALESGWGKSVKGGNYFGIKGKGQKITTHEFIDGKKVKIDDEFKTFNDFSSSVDGLVDFLKTNPRYKDALTKGTPAEQAEALQAAGYATDPKYASKLKSIMKKYVN